MKKKPSAAAGHCEWVINIILYYDVVVQVEPTKQALREATKTLNNANTKLAEVNKLAAELEAKLPNRIAEFDKEMKEHLRTVSAYVETTQSAGDGTLSYGLIVPRST